RETLQTIHALWTLEGLGALSWDDLQSLERRDVSIHIQVLAAAVGMLGDSVSVDQLHALFGDNAAVPDSLLLPHYVLALAAMNQHRPGDADRPLIEAARYAPNDPYVADAVISGFANREEWLMARLADTATTVYRQLHRMIAAKQGKAEKEAQ